MLLPQFLDCNLQSRLFFDFLGVDDDMEADNFKNSGGKILLELECKNKDRLPQFSTESLLMIRVNFSGLNPQSSVNNFVEDKIINNETKVSSDFEIKHYYVELRNLIWHEKVRNIQIKGKEK
jgi:hypothetical protein